MYFFLYLCYYLHTSRDSVSPLCGILLIISSLLDLDNNLRQRSTNSKDKDFQIEFVDGEPVFVCNICNEGINNEAEITKHINDKHESLMSDDLNEGGTVCF